MPGTPWACAVIRLPRRWVSSAMASSSITEYEAYRESVPAVMPPPVANVLIPSTPSSSMSRRTAALTASTPSASPPKKWQWPFGWVIVRPLTSSRGPRLMPRAMTSRTPWAEVFRAPQS